ncbi:helix-turn-helix transcriptional regulator [Bacillus circulans]|jgi:transcriptional regulator with XRE-family HTH domain|uniref:helix-turn-helix transcriptional regulator n=1 Tax=Bacillaceae TaxID=186817 RepID=UPI001561A156|nr:MULTISPECIES: helix-turn-helix transcriptional regulator [Bacillaceae]MCA0120917.1 helix-turn-helix domain-containing protein [Bacillus sp. RSS_NA_20]NRG25607.1 helix-turn-helix transcriptional regulator [Niallia circulans]
MVVTIGRRLKELRVSVGKTQSEVAGDIRFHTKTLRRYEKDQQLPSTDYLIELARYFNVTTDYILGLEEHIPVEVNNVAYTDEENRDMFYEKVEGDAEYYWIYYVEQEDGSAILRYQSQWLGFTNETPPKELRGPVSVDAYKVYNICTERYTSPMMINNTEDMLVFQQKRGHAVIKACLCTEYFPEMIEPIVV